MKTSLITATYNSEKRIRECLESVAGQSHKKIEHILVDGGSTDGTLAIINSNPSISKSISEPDNGIYDALNKGIKLATGDVIGFLHSDDQLGSHDTIKNIVELFQKTGADGVYGDLVFINDENKIVRAWRSESFNRDQVKHGWMPPHPTLFLKKEVYQKHGLFDSSFRIAGDYDFMLRVLLDKDLKLEYLPNVITKMRIGGASTGNVKQLLRKSREDLRALKKNGFRYPFSVLVAKNFRKLPQLFNK